MLKSSRIQSLFDLIKNPIIFLVLLNLVIFHEYWLGISTPPWDFLGGGMVSNIDFTKMADSLIHHHGFLTRGLEFLNIKWFRMVAGSFQFG